MARTVKKTKAEIIAEQVAEIVGAGKEQHLETVDFNDPNRPRTCLEVDLPILQINRLAGLEASSGAATKPIYHQMKWWARRQSSVFRSMLLAAATKAPEDPAEAAKTVWKSYYGNHQKNQSFKNLKVADIFMGGGTTLVEGCRLGMNVTGNDLNPVAWLVVKNELTDIDPDELNKLFDHIENEVKPQIMPFYACEGPGGEKGIWTRKSTGEKMGDGFDPLALTPEERRNFNYDGPEIIYTFWAKHGPCSAPGCGHRTPLMSNLVVAVKTLSVTTWQDITCKNCHQQFDVETSEIRMAPDAPLIVADTEKPYTIIDQTGKYECPHCHHPFQDEGAALKGESIQLPKKRKKNKKIDLTVLVHPDWLKGESGSDENGLLGGTANSDPNATIRWNSKRTASCRLIEVRGELSEVIVDPRDQRQISTKQGTIPKKSHFTCQEKTCGREQDLLEAVKKTGDTGAMAAYAKQYYLPNKPQSDSRKLSRINEADSNRFAAAALEWHNRKNLDLDGYWPREELSFGWKTHSWSIPEHGFTHYSKMFNERQLLTNSLILKAIDNAHGFSSDVKLFALGAFQQFVRSNCQFTFYHQKNNQAAKFLSNNNYHTKNNIIEVPVFSDVGDGSWRAAANLVRSSLDWKDNPWELVIVDDDLKDQAPVLIDAISKSIKVYPKDTIKGAYEVHCESSTDQNCYEDGSLDLIITDPPFGGLMQYAELSDFMFVWIKLIAEKIHPEIFSSAYTPKHLEVVTNPARNTEDPDAYYTRLLTACWSQAYNKLKDGGLLAFTFHHSEDEPWIQVLESLFIAGFYLEATYPIRSDQSKGDNAQFGSQKIEYDIIHVCRKRTEEPTKISWPRLRRQILDDVRQLQSILEHHHDAGLPKADIQVIKRGKALEYFSRHYGQVYVEEGREFTVKEALVGINQLLDDQSEGEAGGTPINCEPITRQFLRIFRGAAEVKRDQIQKYLRGTGIGPSDFISRGWTAEKKKVFHWLSPLEFAKERSEKLKALSRDMDQAMILVGACYENSGIEVKKLLNNEFKPHPALGDLLQWLCSHGADKEMRQSAMTAKQLYSTWAANNQQIVKAQLALFDMEDEA